jgi:single stranded DNA-binding protein
MDLLIAARRSGPKGRAIGVNMTPAMIERAKRAALAAGLRQNVVVWGKQGEHCGQYLAKGRQVYVESSIRTRSYDDKSGNKRYVTEVVAQRVQFLGGGGQPPIDDDVPF